MPNEDNNENDESDNGIVLYFHANSNKPGYIIYTVSM